MKGMGLVPTKRKKSLVALVAGLMGGLLALPAFLASPAAAQARPTAPACGNVAEKNFSDEAAHGGANSEMENAIECIEAYGITTGKADGSYAPNERVSREQMASFLVRKLQKVNGLTLPAGGNRFAGEPISAVHRPNVERIAATNPPITVGYSDGRFRALNPVSREEMATFIVRQLRVAGATLPAADPGRPFPDVAETGNPHREAISILKKMGIVQGNQAGNYDPKGIVTRGSMAIFLSRDVAELVAQGKITPVGPAGAVTVTNSTVEQGGTLNGTVSDPSSVTSLSVSGCGFNNQNVTVGANGAFALTVPQGQSAGQCTLTFVVQRNNGDTQTVTVPITVTARQQTVTGAPDLVSASALPLANTVTYVFDEDVSGSNANFFALFHVYNAAGAQFDGINATVSNDNRSVVVQFAPNVVGNATLATVDAQAVADPGGTRNYPSGVPLTGATLTAGRTAAPDLITVGNPRTTAQGNQLVDFTYDQAVSCSAAPTCTGGALDPNPALHQLVLNDGSVMVGQAVQNISADGRTLSIVFGNTLVAPTVNFGEVRRGVAETGAVRGTSAAAGNPANPLEAEPFAATDGRTQSPDLEAVSVAGTNSVLYDFDQPVDAFAIDETEFHVANANGVEFNGVAGSAVRSTTDATRVTVSFAPGVVGAAVLASVDDDNGGAVVGTTQGNLINRDDERALQNVNVQAGRTALPDLVRVQKIQNQFGDWLVTYEFDSSLTTAGYAACNPADFYLVDAIGAINQATACVIDPNDATKVRISTNAATVGPGIPAGFTNSQVSAAVVGAVDEDQGGTGQGGAGAPVFPEGHSPVGTGV